MGTVREAVRPLPGIAQEGSFGGCVLEFGMIVLDFAVGAGAGTGTGLMLVRAGSSRTTGEFTTGEFVVERIGSLDAPAGGANVPAGGTTAPGCKDGRTSAGDDGIGAMDEPELLGDMIGELTAGGAAQEEQPAPLEIGDSPPKVVAQPDAQPVAHGVAHCEAHGLLQTMR